MYFLGQTIKLTKDNKPGIFLGSEPDVRDYMAYVFCKEDDKKSYDTIMVELDEISRLTVEDKTSITKRKIYYGDCKRDRMFGLLPEKECLELKGQFIKELNKATKQHFK